MKSEYLREGRHTEEQYLALFAEAEQMADRQAGISSISGASLFNLLAFHRHLAEEYRVRARNFRFLHVPAREARCRACRPDYPCLYVLDVDRRDELKRHLQAQRIFLPVHWPNPGGWTTALYDRIISIPVDSRYGEEDLRAGRGGDRGVLRPMTRKIVSITGTRSDYGLMTPGLQGRSRARPASSCTSS